MVSSIKTEYKVNVPLIHNQYCVNSDEKEVSCLYEMTDRYSQLLLIDNHQIRFDIYSSEQKNYCLISGISERDEKHFVNAVKPRVHDLCIMLSYVFNRTNGNLINWQPRVEPDWENKTIESKPITDKEATKDVEQPSNLWLNVGTLSVVSIADDVAISLITKIKPEELELSCLENDAFSFVAHELYTALGTENIRSKFFHLFAIIEYCEEKFKCKDCSTMMFSQDEIDKIHHFFVDNIEEGETKFKRVHATIAHATNIGRAIKLKHIFNAMNIHDIVLQGKAMPIDKAVLDKLIEYRGKLFHGNEVDNSELLQPISILFELAIRVLDYIKDATAMTKCSKSQEE